MDEVTITTTSDTPEQVRAALGQPAVETPVVETPAVETPAVETPSAEAAVTPEAKPEEKPAPKADAKPDVKPDAKAEKPDDKRTEYEKRIDRLIFQREENARLAETLQAKLDAIDAEKAATAKAAAEIKLPETPAEPEEKEPNEDDFPVYGDFMKATARYEARKAAKTEAKAEAAKVRADIDREQKERQAKIDTDRQAAEASERRKSFESKIAKGKETHPDYDEVLAKAANVNIGPVVNGYLRSDDCQAPAELIYYFAQNPAEADRILALAPAAQVREVLRLEIRSENGTLFPERTADEAPAAETPAETKKIPVSAAPAPVGRVGQGATTPAKDPNAMTFVEYKKYRASGGR